MGVCSTTDWMGLGGVFVVPVLVAAVLSQQCNPVTSGGSETCAAHKPNSPSIDATTEPSSTSSSGVLELTEESFDHHVGKDNKALSGYIARGNWPSIHRICKSQRSSEAPTLTARYGILSYPTLQLFRGGKHSTRDTSNGSITTSHCTVRQQTVFAIVAGTAAIF
eukprot:c20748_g1_i18.p1 GENE.c20748_g1_i18~~c20748_g1_i18.p1  ORF type:complete len:165 (+),score=23.20 c20748_g1_i18:1-495(+)